MPKYIPTKNGLVAEPTAEEQKVKQENDWLKLPDMSELSDLVSNVPDDEEDDAETM